MTHATLNWETFNNFIAYIQQVDRNYKKYFNAAITSVYCVLLTMNEAAVWKPVNDHAKFFFCPD